MPYQNNLSPKISLSKANNQQQNLEDFYRKKIYTEHDNQHVVSDRPGYYQCATDRTPNTSKNYQEPEDSSKKKMNAKYMGSPDNKRIMLEKTQEVGFKRREVRVYNTDSTNMRQQKAYTRK